MNLQPVIVSNLKPKLVKGDNKFELSKSSGQPKIEIPRLEPISNARALLPVTNMININPLAPGSSTVPIGKFVVMPKIMMPNIGKIRPIIPKPESIQLKWLAVKHGVRSGPALKDDTYAPLTCTWHDNLVRIANIGDGSCFIHAILKAFYKPYQDNNNAKYRLQTAAEVRRDLGVLLSLENPEYPDHVYWETTGRGQFPALLMQEIVDENMINGEMGDGEEAFLDYSLYGLQRFFNSYFWIGDESYNFISDAFNIDIFVMRINTKDVISHIHTKVPDKKRDAIVIVSNDAHYETLALKTKNGFQTVFPPDDPFIDILTKRFIGEGNFNDITNMTPYDPDEVFIRNIVESFTNKDTLQFKIPDMVFTAFAEYDPLRLTLDRLRIEIDTAAREYMAEQMSRPFNQLQAVYITALQEEILSKEQIDHIKDVLRFTVDKNEQLDPENQVSAETLVINAQAENFLDNDLATTLIKMLKIDF